MRIVILADPLDNQRAGVHVYTKELVHSLINHKGEHEVILIREKRDDNLTGVRQIILKNTRLPIGYASFRLFVLVPLVVRWLKADVVIEPAHFGPFNLPHTIKRVTIIHDLTPILFPELHRPFSQWLQRLFLKGILKKTDLVVTNSDHTQQDLCSVYPFACEKSKRIYPGVSNALKEGSNQPVHTIQGLVNPYFLVVGTIEPRKNHLLTLKAFEAFKCIEKESHQLIIVGGKGWKSEAFFEALEQSPFRNDIIMPGHVDIGLLKSLYKNAIALIYPSKYEGFGFPVIEALHFGTHVITTKNSSLTEVGGNFAAYISGNSTKELVEKMAIAASGIKKMNTLALDKHLRKFSWNNFGKTFIAALEELIQ